MRLKVLIVEDDPIQADILAGLLGSHGYYVDIAVDGRYALRQICTGTFDVALIDYRLPEIDGQSLARVVHTLGGSFHRPRLVALTSSPQDLVGGLADFDEILSKPFVLESLLQSIERSRSTNPVADPAVNATQISPCASATLAETVPTRLGAIPHPSGHILLAEDDAHLREFLRLALESRGFEVDVANDGLEAVGCIGTSAYDVVVLDFNMPKLDGLAAAKIIYDLSDRRTRPRIVALTSTPASLIAQDPRWHLVLDEVVSKQDGIPAILSAIDNCINYKAIRSQNPLEALDLQLMMGLVQNGD